MEIPFNKVSLTGKENIYVQKAVENLDKKIFTSKCAEWIKSHMSVKEVIMTSSGTSALELAVRSICSDEDSQIILPSFTFPSAANAILLAGAQPVFCEIDAHTLCMDINDFQTKITPNTKAVIVVDYGGISPHIEKLIDIARENNLMVIEDSAHAFLSSYKEKPLGTWGDFGIFSFHTTKNIVCGEGGALLVNTNNINILDHIHHLYYYGTNRIAFLNGQSSSYSWHTTGLNPQPSELSMAFLLAQLEESHLLTQERQQIFLSYYKFLDEHSNNNGILSFSRIYPNHDANCHTFYIVFENQEMRDYMIQQLRKRHINAYFHFVPLHLSPMGKKLGYTPSDFPVTNKVSAGLLRLPLYNEMTEKECQFVVQSVKEILEAF